MEFTVNIWVVLFSCGFAMGLFIASLFILFHKRYSSHTQHITVVLLLLSLMLFTEIAEEANIVDRYPFMVGISPVMDLLIWPFLLFYVHHIVGKQNRRGWSTLLYFSPFIVALGWQIPFLQLPDQAKLTYFSAGIPDDVAILVTFKLCCTLTFLLTIHQMLTKAHKKLSTLFSQSKKAAFLSKFRQFTVGVTCVVVLIYGMFYIQYFEFFDLGDSDRIGSLIISGCIYLLAILIYNNPQLLLKESYSSHVTNFFNGTEESYVERLMNLFEDRKLHLNERLTVSDVALEMELNEQQLSYLVNRQLGITFLDFINTFRVKEMKEAIHRGDHTDKTLLGLAMDSGFNSKASFNRIFKDHTGKSPSAYVKSKAE